MMRPISHVVGFDDFPFSREQRGEVRVVGAVFAGPRMEGVLSCRVRRDGANAAARLAGVIQTSKFREHLQLVMLQGIALAGFNVVDVFLLHRRLHVPVLVVARRQPDMEAIRRALLERVPGGARKWKIIERLGPMEPAGGVFIQRVGLDRHEGESLVTRFAVHGTVPEPLRVAHLIAGGIGRGVSGRRV